MPARRPIPATSGQHARETTTDERALQVERPRVIDLRDRRTDRLLLTVEEAADRLGIGRSLMYELIGDGQVPSIRVGRLRRVPTDSLVEYVAALRRRAQPPDPAA